MNLIKIWIEVRNILKLILLTSFLFCNLKCNKHVQNNHIVIENLRCQNTKVYYEQWNKLKISKENIKFLDLELSSECIRIKKDFNKKLFNLFPNCDIDSELVYLKKEGKIIDSILFDIEYIPFDIIKVNGLNYLGKVFFDETESKGKMIAGSSVDKTKEFEILKFDIKIISNGKVKIQKTIEGDNLFSEGIQEILTFRDIIKISNVTLKVKKIWYSNNEFVLIYK